MHHLNDYKLFGKNMRINISKKENIAMPRPNDEDAGRYTKDYTDSPLHRYKIQGSKNYGHICQPSPILHVSNIPGSVNENSMRELFSQHGNTVLQVKFFSNNHKMAFIQMQSVEEAINALVLLHNYKIEGSYIRVSFTTKTSIPS